MPNKFRSVPLGTPGFNLLKADAVWVTISNWAEGLSDYYGRAEVLAGSNTYTAEQIKSKCFVSTAPKRINRKPRAFRKSYVGKLLETLVKDIRWFLADQKQVSIDLSKFNDVPFVWQHHDLFQTQGLRLAKKAGVPSVLFVDAPYVWESRKWGVLRLGWEWFARKRGDALPCKLADLVLVVSEEVKQAIVSLGIHESKVLVTPCTVSANKFDKADGIKIRSLLGIDNNFVIGWVGSFRKFHSLDLLLDAFVDVVALSPNLKLMLVGDGPERIRLQEKATKLGLEKQTIFTGNIPHTEIPAYISSFDVAVLPAQSGEGFHYSPLKLREFFAAGVPVIASSVGDVKKVIESSNGGWLVEPGNKNYIADMIKKVEGNRESLNRAAANARAYALAEMGISKQIRMIEDYFGLKK